MSKFVYDDNHQRFDIEEALTITKGVWGDNNPTGADRIGLFVTSSNDNYDVMIANSNSYLSGVTVKNDAFLGGDTDAKYCVVQSLGVCTIQTAETVVAGDKVMPNDQGKAVKSNNDLGFRVVEVLEGNKAKIIFAPNNDMVQRIKADVQAVEASLDGLKFKSLTQAEYDALPAKDSNTIYLVGE